MFSVPLQALAVCLGYLVIEAISRHSVTDAFTFMTTRPLVFLYNAFLIFTTTLLVYLVRRRVFMRVLLATFWLLLGIINGGLLAVRVTPFTGPDLNMISDALGILNKYLSPVLVVAVVILFVFLIAALVLLFIKGPKYQGRLSYKWNIPLILASALALVGVTNLALEKRVLSNYFGNIAFAYEDYGYPYCLIVTIFDTGISMPRDYSEEAIAEILESTDDLLETDTENMPNIIFLQLESFFDPALVNYLELSEDPIPNFRKLMSEYSSGYFRVPSVGAGTANTEFETITGMNLRYFGAGEYPYKSILKETTSESAPFVLKELGYTAHAVHNNEANFYGRRTVFANLGFDTFISEEFMADQSNVTPIGWMRDEVLTKYITDCLDSTKNQDYVYAISVQGHGDYPAEPMIEDPKITATGSETEEQNYKWEYYVNQLYEMDQFIQELLEALEERDEDTMVVMYGDHLPTMDLTVQDVENKYLYQTEYVIWDNMGLERKEENLSTYQMAAEVMDRAGIHEGTIFRYHQARRMTKNYQVDLEMLQYDILYGKQYAYQEENPFEKTQIQLGVKEVTVDSIEKVSTGNYYISGSNFTPSSYLEVNGELLEVTYIHPGLLLLVDTELENGNKVNVAMRSNSSTRKILSRTNTIYYYEPITAD